jgi:putative ABC transport system permease protein
MFRNYLTIAWRNILRHKLFSFINVLGLSLGISVCLLIILMIVDQFSYDAYNPTKTGFTASPLSKRMLIMG